MIWKKRPQIRRLTARDAAIWRELRLEALHLHPEAYGSTHDDWAGQPLQAFADRLTAGTIFGAFKQVGLIGSTALDPDPDDPETGLITAVYVAPAHRGTGVARALLRSALKEASRRGMVQVALNVATCNHAAVRLYQAAGFRSAGQEPRALARNGRLLDQIRMVRPIRA